MLNKKNRLKKRKEYNFIYKKGQSFYTKYLSLYIVKTKSINSKIGFSIASKVGNSVIRHRIKRIMSEIIKEKINILPKNNYVFVAKNGCENFSFEEMKQNIEFILKKANIES